MVREKPEPVLRRRRMVAGPVPAQLGPSGTGAPVGAVHGGPCALTAVDLLRLQRQAGNDAVSTALVLQRANGKGTKRKAEELEPDAAGSEPDEEETEAASQAAEPPPKRARVTPREYLKGIVAARKDDPEWNPEWEAALNNVAAAPGLPSGAEHMMDPNSERHALGLVKVSGELAKLGSGDTSDYRHAANAIRWHAGIESSVSSSGFGTLDVSKPALAGRPAFPKVTQAAISLRGGQHRRHILAWHSIRDFVRRAVEAHRKVVLDTIRRAYEQPPAGSSDAFAEAHEHVVKKRGTSREKSPALTDDELLKVGLFVMNGNPRNLWAGRGNVNSALNTAYMAMSQKLTAVATFSDLADLQVEWAEAKGKAVYRAATRLGADVLAAKSAAAWERYATLNDPAAEAGLVHEVVRELHEEVLSNLELDVLGDTRVMTELANEKAGSLHDHRALIDNVVTGAVQIGDVDAAAIRAAILAYLTHA